MITMSKVILNVGHGGLTKDPGACGNGIREHYWNKEFVETILIPKIKEAKLDYTEVNQTIYKTLAAKINNVAKKGDITLSFHLNDSDNKSAEGPEMLYYVKSKNSERLATILQKNVLNALKIEKDRRGIKPKTLVDRGGSLLVRTTTPTVILEPAFVSNLSDISRLDLYKKEYADAVVKSIKEYFEG